MGRDFVVVRAMKSLLERPELFDAYQAAVGANRAKQEFVSSWVCPKYGDRVLDIGCGTGAVLPFLPSDVQVTGIDIHSPYIEAARVRYGSRATFLVGDAADPSIDLAQDFDTAYAFGVFHHLPDDAARRLVTGALKHLRRGGRFVSIDPTLVDGQGWLSRFFVSNDRGEYIRTPGQLLVLFAEHEPRVQVRTDLLRIPFAQALLSIAKA
jgi:SAM-dependent methyltransferase